MRASIQTVGIIGSGPAGATLASLLAWKGLDVTLFDDGRRPDLIVGESLVPAIVPVLRKLGLEERAAAFSLRKPGVTFTFSPDEQVAFSFQTLAGSPLPPYAYNVPRPAFDRLLDGRADELGVKRARAGAKIERTDGDGLRLSEETLSQAPWLGGRQPDLLVDATGRCRLFARALRIPAETGPRKDVAYFAHYEGFDDPQPRGQVIIGRLARGWCWRIPLRDRLSVGVVTNKEAAAELGGTPAERLEAAIRRDPLLAHAGRDRRRLTGVVTYSNYQLVSERGHGPGWVAAGDAFGFVDPMLSPGMWLALHSAELLAEHLEDLPAYSRRMRRLIKAWMGLIEYFYDGRIFAMYQTGMAFKQKYPGRIAEGIHEFFNHRVACMASGLTTTSRFGRALLRFMSRPAGLRTDPASLAIR
ncbi:MAG: NAD(P)/FAD-dependent oxidoreductase [Verrucomicrobiota bacterium]|nr:NAD(P)/FAD-dependent oxidoreductase [Verrucomicrobiota bacterium]